MLGIVLILLGIIDWATTVLGVHYLGAVELNPLFAGVINSNILVYSIIKIVAALLIGFLFYKGYVMAEGLDSCSNLGKLFLRSGYLTSFTALTAVVANNIIAIVSIL
ncbi:MAG: DUF5658 family protein [Candidatus Bathyarchaeota archaeon]|nr:DUF5658 family protein [Candidatus Bathyarchaeota archaeon]